MYNQFQNMKFDPLFRILENTKERCTNLKIKMRKKKVMIKDKFDVNKPCWAILKIT